MNQAVDFWERFSIISSCPLFRSLDRPTIEQIAHGSVKRTYGPGETLYRKDDEADSILLVVNGLVRLSILSPAGREFSLQLAARGDILGEASLAALPSSPSSAQIRETDCVAVSYSKVLKIRHDILPRATTMGLAHDLNLLLLRRLTLMVSIIEELALHNLENRIAQLLLRLDQQRPSPLHQLTQTLLASMANATRPRVNETLKKLHHSGAIQLRGGQVTAIDKSQIAHVLQRSE